MLSLFELHIKAQATNKRITSLQISLDSPTFIFELLQSKQNLSSLYVEYPHISALEITFLNWLISVYKNHSKDKSYQQLIFHAPFSQELIYFLGKIPTLISIDAQPSIAISYNKNFFSPSIFLDIANATLSLTAKDNNYLIPSTIPYILHKNNIAPLQMLFKTTMIDDLFSQGHCPINISEGSVLVEEIQKGNSTISKFLSIPKFINSNNISPTIEFSYNKQNNKYELSLFLEVIHENKNYTFPLNLLSAQQFLKSSTDFAINGENNTALLISHDQPVRKEIEHIVTTSFKNFYSVLGEIENNNIITDDRSNFFEKFLPSISNSVQIFHKGKKNKLQFILANENPNISIQKQSNTPLFGSIDWLSINFEYNYNNLILSLTDLEKIITEGFIEKNDMLISVSEESLDPIKKLLEFKKNKKNSELQIQASFLPWLLTLYPNAQIPEEWSELKDLINHDKIPTIDIPNNVPLRDYQKNGVERLALLHKFGFGIVLADEMGLGKTLQILALLDIYQKTGTTLIVTPSALLLNWEAEIKKFFPDRFKILIINGHKKDRDEKIKLINDHDIVITSYHMLGFDLNLYQDHQFNFCVIDEAQHIKNYKSKRAKSVKQIKANSKIAVSGTPLENHVEELWSIFDFIMPGFLGSHTDFAHTFTDKLLGFDTEVRKKTLEHLSHMCNPFIIRRTKNVVYKELPSKIEQTIITELNPKQKALYVKTLDQVKNQFQNIIKDNQFNYKRFEFLSSLTKLRQISLHPGLVHPELENADVQEYSSKMVALLELLDDALESGHRILVFSQFVSMLQIIKTELDKQQIEYLYLDGKTNNRLELTEQFNNSSIPIFLISLRAGGVGLNLTGADTVILFDPWWNPAVENQAIDRTHRIGQQKVVNIYRIMTKGTIEEKIHNLQRQKDFLFENIMQENANFGNFSAEDLLSLISTDNND